MTTQPGTVCGVDDWRDEPFWRDIVEHYAVMFPTPLQEDAANVTADLPDELMRQRMMGRLEGVAYFLAADAGAKEQFPLEPDSPTLRAIYEDVEDARKAAKRPSPTA